MRCVLVGPGAIGGTVAAFATQAGFALDVVCSNAELAKQLRTEGFRLRGARGTHTVKLHTFAGIDSLEQGYDIAIIATKAFVMPELARQLLPKMQPDCLLLHMQNGVCTQLLADVVGEERCASCMVGFGATLYAPGDVEMTSLGELVIGMPDGQKNEKLDYLAGMLGSVLPTKISDNIIGELFSKLIINSCINSLGALTGGTLGRVLDEKKARQIFLAVAREGILVARGMGVRVPAYNGILNYNLLLLSKNKRFDALCETLFRKIGKKKYSDVKVSTLQALECGEKTEIDYFNGYLAQKGAQVGVQTPVCTQLTAFIHEIERGERQISMENLQDVVID